MKFDENTGMPSKEILVNPTDRDKMSQQALLFKRKERR